MQMTELQQRIVVQREQPPTHTGGWSVQREITDELEELREVLDRLVDPHEGVEIDPQAEDIERAQTLVRIILGDDL